MDFGTISNVEHRTEADAFVSDGLSLTRIDCVLQQLDEHAARIALDGLNLLTRLTVEFIPILKMALLCLSPLRDDSSLLLPHRGIACRLPATNAAPHSWTRPTVDDRNQAVETEWRARIGDNQRSRRQLEENLSVREHGAMSLAGPSLHRQALESRPQFTQHYLPGCCAFFWPTVLLAAKTYGKGPRKRAVSADLCTFEGERPVLARTVRRCME